MKLLTLLKVSNIVILVIFVDCSYEENPCGNHEFECDNGQCISDVSICDKDDNCQDQSDEIFCPNEATCTAFDIIINGHDLGIPISTFGWYCKILTCLAYSQETNCGGRDFSFGAAEWVINTTTNHQNVKTILRKNGTVEYEEVDSKNKIRILTKINSISKFMEDQLPAVLENGGYYSIVIGFDASHFRPKVIERESRVTTLQGATESTGYISLNYASKPTFLYRNLQNSTVTITKGKDYELVCNATGQPKPQVTWTWKSEDSSKWSKHFVYLFSKEKTVLLIQNISPDVEGVIECTAKNLLGSTSAFIDIVVEVTDLSSQLPMLLGSVTGCTLILVFGAFVLHYRYKLWKLNRAFAGLSQKDFYDGDVANINPNMSVSDQANLLPFQQTTWEISKVNLKMGIPLGSGTFGLVLKAEAYEVVEGEERTTVAVKTVKPEADVSHFKALMTELKIMAHLGKHLNVVNLIGAVTKDLAKKKELFVVMEFCKYGSILSYMHRNRGSFINQVDPETDTIDSSISPRAEEAYRTMIRKQKRNRANLNQSQIESSNNGYSPDDMKVDYQLTDVESICSTDLLNWAFQVANGMEYLSSRKVLHGDLAARNVLLAENNVVKICDFGFARETFINYDYKKNINGVLLPIKWMAIESINCGLFSSKSDCWSYGVLLWEIFTLGNKPYPGMEINEHFCQRINDGYRMEKPQYAPTCVYQIMRDCWLLEPSERPTFSQLSDRLRKLLSDSVYTKLYDLNEANVRFNLKTVMSPETNYLSRMGNAELCMEVANEESNFGSAPNRNDEIPKSPSVDSEPSCSVVVETTKIVFSVPKKLR